MSRASCLYDGVVTHRRFEPVRHDVHVALQLLYADLDELPGLFEGSRLWRYEGFAPVSFRRRDHLGDPARPLDDCVRELVEARLGRRPDGPIRLLTHPRYLGFVFNPASFFYCFAADGHSLEALVCEVTNTPWGERYYYVLPARSGSSGDPSETSEPSHVDCPKQFHVSPFLDMDQDYTWTFQAPGERLRLGIRNRRDERTLFRADLTLRRREISTATLARTFRHQPFVTAGLLFRIYAHALQLWRKGVPFVSHPELRWPRAFADRRHLDAPADAGKPDARCLVEGASR